MENDFKIIINSIKTIIIDFKNNRKLAIVIILFFVILSFFYARSKNQYYVATTTYILQEEGSTQSGLGGLAGQLGFAIGNGSESLFTSPNLSEFIKSRTIIENILLSSAPLNKENTTWAEYYIRVNKLRERGKISNEIKFLLNSSRSELNTAQIILLEQIHQDLVSPEHLEIGLKNKKASIYQIVIKNEDENFAKYFCDKLVQTISKYYIETKSKKAKLIVDVLEYQVDSLRMELDKSINGFASISDNNFNINSALVNVKSASGTKRKIDVETNTAILKQVVVNLETAKMNLRKETPLIQVIDLPLFPLKRETTNIKMFLIYGTFFGFFVSLLAIKFKIILKK
jgi:uncharacterized protein involved in exopolysaccharide biosynthesis